MIKALAARLASALRAKQSSSLSTACGMTLRTAGSPFQVLHSSTKVHTDEHRETLGLQTFLLFLV